MDNRINDNYVAHVKQSEDGSWSVHRLADHLRHVGDLASTTAQTIASQDWAEIAGRWHDLGKYRKRFQDYIRLQSGYERENAHIENSKRAPHSTAGAIHAVQNLPPGFGHIIAYLIAGHHAGLPDWHGGRGSLSFRLIDGQSEYEEALSSEIPSDILQYKHLALSESAGSADTISLWIRILFSCLVDADFLDTERFMQREKANQRHDALSLINLDQQFSRAMDRLQAKADSSQLNDIRNSILNECLASAEWKPGLFSLTVPTGGGKTLSSLAFALKHARLYNKRRIIYAIPFTSIIEQNAEVFRKFLGDDAVLEHHCNLDVEPSKENSRLRLASENWDAPLIVTTNVQLFESLHASRTSRCRKLHNLVNSVIILDEAQQIPRDFHAPITQIMQQLSDHFGVTWVLCTATQPELSQSKDTFGRILLQGLNNVREIISKPLALASQLKRVDIHLPVQDAPKISWQKLADEVGDLDCVLVIVNTRRHARTLFELIPDDHNNLHLSAHMCAEHRSHVIEAIKRRLQQRRDGSPRPLRVVSTQLVEAGVDVDFPVVYRAMAGLDSIAQSAGRCNREGKLDGRGQVIVFKPEQSSPPGFLRQGEDTTLELIASKKINDPLSPESFTHYFTQMNAKGERDKHHILQDLKAEQSANAPLAIQFRTAARKFRLIDDTGVSVIVPYIPDADSPSPVEAWISQLGTDASQKWIYKKLQRYTVTLPESLAKAFQAARCLDVRAGQFVLLEPYYHPVWGVDSPDTLISAENSVI